MIANKICFFISPIGKEGSPERKRSDQVIKHIIEPIADSKFGYKVIRADQIGKPGIITSQVIQHVLESELVIADLAFRNPNVFYEVALRHLIRKPFIHMIEEGETIPFDVAALRTIYLDHKDLDSADRARQQLNDQIEAIHADPENVESPVTQAIDVRMLRGSGKQTEQYLGEIMDMLSGIKAQIAEFKDQSSPSYTFNNVIPPVATAGKAELASLLSPSYVRMRDMLVAPPTEKVEPSREGKESSKAATTPVKHVPGVRRKKT